MNNQEQNSSRAGGQRGQQRDTDFTDAMTRLESAVQELVGATTDQLSQRATKIIDDTSKRIEAEIRMRNAVDDDEEVVAQAEQRKHRRQHRRRFEPEDLQEAPVSSRLLRDTENEKVAGVCAGLANYFDTEAWVVRMGALTGALFFPAVVIPAYFVAYFVMDTPDKADRKARKGGRRKKRGRRARASARQAAAAETQLPPPEDYRPGRSLRHTLLDLKQAELRLRRIEGFVTSDQYELHRELNKMQKGA
ncbi:MAG: PspC domain-containing protein [Pseudomonadota bacterium]